jgi:hypothetical protein
MKKTLQHQNSRLSIKKTWNYNTISNVHTSAGSQLYVSTKEKKEPLWDASNNVKEDEISSSIFDKPFILFEGKTDEEEISDSSSIYSDAKEEVSSICSSQNDEKLSINTDKICEITDETWTQFKNMSQYYQKLTDGYKKDWEKFLVKKNSKSLESVENMEYNNTNINCEENISVFSYLLDILCSSYNIPYFLQSHYFYLGITVLIGNWIISKLKPKVTNNEKNYNTNASTYYSSDTTDNLITDNTDDNMMDYTEDKNDEDISDINHNIDKDEINPINPKPVIKNPYINNPVFKALLEDFQAKKIQFDRYQSNKNFINRILERVPQTNKMKRLKSNLSKRTQARLTHLITSQGNTSSNQIKLIQSLNDYLNNTVKVYEDSVGSLVYWLLDYYFDCEKWSKTPEQVQNTRKRPDMMVSGLYKGKLVPKILVEIKKYKGDSFKKIMKQIDMSGLSAVSETADETKFDGPAMFHVAVRGTEIAFMERYNYKDILDDAEIPNYSGIIPLTQPVNTEVGIENEELKHLFEEMWERSSKKISNHFPYDEDMNNNYAIRGQYYVFDMEKDHEIISKLFYYISSNLPRIHIVD